MVKWVALVFVLVCCVAGSAFAKDDVRYKKRTIIDLSAAVIEGELTRPEGSYIVNRKLAKFKENIVRRVNFRGELHDTQFEL